MIKFEITNEPPDLKGECRVRLEGDVPLAAAEAILHAAVQAYHQFKVEQDMAMMNQVLGVRPE